MLEKLKPTIRLSKRDLRNYEPDSKKFILRHIEFERGMIKAWEHIRNLCNICIKSHRAELTKKRIKELVEMNKDLE